MENIQIEKTWWVYILRCNDDSLYTGVTDDIQRRIAAHNCGRGAKYTRGRGPLQLVYKEQFETRGQALQREYAIKRLRREQKLELIRRSNCE